MTTQRPEVAMVLAAGRGERMRPLSDVLPKPALPLPPGPLMSSAVHQVVAAGAGRIVVNSWHLSAKLRSALDRVDSGLAAVMLSLEPKLMGSAGGLALARDRGYLDGDGPILVMNADCVVDLDLEPLLVAHSSDQHLVTLAVLPHPDPHRWSRVVVGGDGRVAGIEGPSSSPASADSYLYTGAMLVSRPALQKVPSAVGGVWECLWRPALTEELLGAVVVGGSWREVGTPASYLECAVDLLGGDSRVSSSARVEADAILDQAFIGRGGRVDAGAEVRRTVVAEGARVGRGARVHGSVLLGPVRVRPGETVSHEIRASGGHGE